MWGKEHGLTRLVDIGSQPASHALDAGPWFSLGRSWRRRGQTRKKSSNNPPSYLPPPKPPIEGIGDVAESPWHDLGPSERRCRLGRSAPRRGARGHRRAPCWSRRASQSKGLPARTLSLTWNSTISPSQCEDARGLRQDGEGEEQVEEGVGEGGVMSGGVEAPLKGDGGQDLLEGHEMRILPHTCALHEHEGKVALSLTSRPAQETRRDSASSTGFEGQATRRLWRTYHAEDYIGQRGWHGTFLVGPPPVVLASTWQDLRRHGRARQATSMPWPVIPLSRHDALRWCNRHQVMVKRLLVKRLRWREVGHALRR